jgi:hypothetical protein
MGTILCFRSSMVLLFIATLEWCTLPRSARDNRPTGREWQPQSPRLQILKWCQRAMILLGSEVVTSDTVRKTWVNRWVRCRSSCTTRQAELVYMVFRPPIVEMISASNGPSRFGSDPAMIAAPFLYASFMEHTLTCVRQSPHSTGSCVFSAVVRNQIIDDRMVATLPGLRRSTGEVNPPSSVVSADSEWTQPG